MRYRVFLMLVANSVAAHAPALAHAMPERRVRALQLEAKRLFIEPGLLPFVADISMVRASVLPPSNRIAVQLSLYTEQDPARAINQTLHLRANVLWPVARIRTASGVVTQVSLFANRRARVRREYRTEQLPGKEVSTLVAGQHGVTIDRTEQTVHGIEMHGRAWHLGGGSRAFVAVVRRPDLAYTFDLGKIGQHWLRIDVRGERLLGLSAIGEG